MSFAFETDTDATAWGLRNAHDPTVVRGDDGLWYMFSTDAAVGVGDIPAGAHVRTSPDLVTWTFAGTALPGVPAPAAAHASAVGLWAPEVVRWPGADSRRRWHMYYSASSFGSRTSAIGLATAPAASGPWTDEGIVVATQHDRDGHNAIDAAIVFDRTGVPWMTYGSFFGGIHILRLDPATGLAQTPGEHGTVIARRSRSVDGAIEGAYIQYLPERDQYALYVSYDSLFDSYSVRVGFADDVTGPYADATGLPLLDPAEADAQRAGTKILGAHRFAGGTAWIAPGHNSVFADGDATFLVHHVRRADDPTRHEAQVRGVHLTAAGIPVVSPHPFAGHAAESLAAPRPASGVWQVVRWAPEVAGVVDAQQLRIDTQIVSAGEPVTGSLVITASDADTAAGETVLDAVVFGAFDPVSQSGVLAFGGIDRYGVVWTGSQEPMT